MHGGSHRRGAERDIRGTVCRVILLIEFSVYYFSMFTFDVRRCRHGGPRVGSDEEWQ